MYDVINLTIPEKKKNPLDQFSLGIFSEASEPEITIDQIYTEAVFTNGKQTLMPIVEILKKIKDLLEEQIAEQDKGVNENKEIESKREKGEHLTKVKVKYFDPKAFWKNQLFKQLEDEFSKLFGFRDVSIEPYVEKYNSAEKLFESKVLSAEILHADRFPIEGLVTDKGFYDNSRSIRMQIYLSLGLIRVLTAEELMGIILHEFGHSIDPALVNIKYTEVNILSKYLTDRKHAINKDEKKYIEKHKNKVSPIFSYILITSIAVGAISSIFKVIKNFILKKNKVKNKEKEQEKKLDKIKNLIENDKDKFNRQEFSEAFADNFARMYGFGPQLISALNKTDKYYERVINSRFKEEEERQKVILLMVEDAIKDEHKTNIHRARALIKEYKSDINNPNISTSVKKQLQDDMEEIEKMLHEYLNNFGGFQNRVNNLINEELEKIDLGAENKNLKNDSKDEKKEEPTKEEPITESKKSHVNDVTSSEREEFYKIFGKSQACSLAKDKNGYYVRTHRARSKSYPEIAKIPKKDVEFVRSTS